MRTKIIAGNWKMNMTATQAAALVAGVRRELGNGPWPVEVVVCPPFTALKAAAASDWVDVDLARLNPIGRHMDADPATVIGVLRQMKAAGKGIIGMKILAQGDLRSKADEALQYALAQDVLDCFTIGAENRGELEDLLKKIPAASVRG